MQTFIRRKTLNKLLKIELCKFSKASMFLFNQFTVETYFAHKLLDLLQIETCQKMTICSLKQSRIPRQPKNKTRLSPILRKLLMQWGWLLLENQTIFRFLVFCFVFFFFDFEVESNETDFGDERSFVITCLFFFVSFLQCGLRELFPF